MRWILPFVMLGLLAAPATAEDTVAPVEESLFMSADGVDLNDFLWLARPVIVFADAPADPRFARQMQMLESEVEALRERDVIVITDTDPAGMSAVREKLRPRGFMMVLIGKDGGVKLRKPLPYSVREISRTIDKMPMRQQEIEDRRGEG